MSDLLKKAYALAREKHVNQEYRSQNYVDGHIKKVVATVAKYTSNQLVQVAAVLHDIVEDTDVTVEDVKKEFGSIVADLVWRLTDESGANRKERKQKTYPKIAKSSNAVLIKLADRLVNMTDSTKLEMYRKEYPDFKKALYKKGEWDDIWNKLDRINE